MFTIKSKYDILKIVNTAKEEKEDHKMKRTHTILATITLISVILTSACTAGSANSSTSTSSAPETAVTTTTAPAVTGTVIDRIDEPKAEATTAQTTATTAATTKPQETKAIETTVVTTTAMPQETKKAETTVAQTTTVATTAKPKPATTTTAATTKPAPEWTETKTSGTKYVNVDCYSRKKAVIGAETVKLYSVNDKVTVIAKTDTGYFKLSDGSFIHSDYLSDSKITQPAAPATKKAETTKPADTTTKKQERKPAEDNWRFTKQDCEDILKACEKYAKDNGYGYCKPSDFGTVKSKVYQHSTWTQVYANDSRVPNLRWEGYTRKEKMIAILCENIELNASDGFNSCIDYCLASEYYEWLKSEGVKNPETHTACQDLTAYVFFPCMG